MTAAWTPLPGADLTRLPPGTRVRVHGEEGELRSWAAHPKPRYILVEMITDLGALVVFQVALTREVHALLPSAAPVRVESERVALPREIGATR